MNYSVLLLFIFLCIYPIQCALAIDAMIKVPVKCKCLPKISLQEDETKICAPSCGDDIELSDAKKSYENLLLHRKKCLDQLKDKKNVL